MNKIKAKSNGLRVIVTLAITMAFLLSCAVSALAYFDRGPVTVTVGQSAVTVEQGGEVTVSVTVTPSSDSQLPGCGMPECPQSCGEKNCLNEDGECMCNGLEYKTYYADVKTESSNTAVATASYGNGTIAIRGVAAGEATITVTGMLRQYTQDSKTIKVTVNEKAAAATAKPADTAKKKEDKPSKIEVVKPEQNDNVGKNNNVVQVADEKQDKDPAQEKKEEQPEVAPAEEQPEDTPANASENGEENGTYTVNSDRGKITFVPLQDGAMGKTEMAAVAGRQAFVNFQKKDEADNILYAWEFNGMDINAPADIDMSIQINTQLQEAVKKQVGNENAVMLDFAQQGELPGKASVSLRVGDYFANGTPLQLFYYDEANEALDLQADHVVVENGYVTFPLEHCSQYLLLDGALVEAGGVSPVLLAVIAVVVIVIIIAAVVVVKRKRA